MGIYKHFFPTKSLKGKVLRIEDEIKHLVKPFCNERFWIERYGVYEIDPRHLAFWVCVKTDEMKKSLKSNIQLMKSIKLLFEKYDYPKQARDKIYVDFESQETVNRDSGGNWYIHFK